MNAHISFENHAPMACPMCGAPARPRMLVAHIQAVVAAFYKINVNYMWSAQRGRDVAWPRQVAMYLSRELTPLSLPALGKRFGRRDHTTIMYGISAVQRRMLDDCELEEDIKILRERLATDQEVDPDGVSNPQLCYIRSSSVLEAADGRIAA
jgi:hypothetical protein